MVKEKKTVRKRSMNAAYSQFLYFYEFIKSVTAILIHLNTLYISFQWPLAKSLKRRWKWKVFYKKLYPGSHKHWGERSNFDSHKIYHDRQEIHNGPCEVNSCFFFSFLSTFLYAMPSVLNSHIAIFTRWRACKWNTLFSVFDPGPLIFFSNASLISSMLVSWFTYIMLGFFKPLASVDQLQLSKMKFHFI